MRRFLFVLASFAAFSCLELRAQIGNHAPDFVVRKWINSPPLTLEELRGRAVLIEVFRTWSDESLQQVSGLSARYDKGSAKGLVVIAVTDEEPAIVEHWVRKHEPHYPVASLTSAEFERALGARGAYPIEAVIDGQGTLVHSTALVDGGFESPLANALASATQEPLWPKKLVPAIERLRDGQVGAAWMEVDTVLSTNPGEPLRATADKLRAQLAPIAQDVEADARRFFAEGRLFEAKRWVSTVTVKSGRTPVPNAETCAKLLADIAAAPNVEAELRAGPAFVTAYELELERDFSAALDGYRAFAKQNAKLAIGAVAQKRIDDLTARGCVGYVKGCPDCAVANKACAAHAAKPKK